MATVKRKSGRQVRFLFSEGSPLTAGQKEKLADEIRGGVVKVKGGKSQIARQPRKHRRVKRVRRDTRLEPR